MNGDSILKRSIVLFCLVSVFGVAVGGLCVEFGCFLLFFVTFCCFWCGATVAAVVQTGINKFFLKQSTELVSLMAKGEFLVEVNQKMTAIIIKEFSRDGVKIQSNAVGKVTGKYSARRLETIDILQKQDGSNRWDSRIVETTSEGDVIMIAAKGKGVQDSPSTLTFRGKRTIMTQSKKLSSLNSRECWIEGTNDLENNVATFKVYLMK
jgi:hypothetical protein